VQLRYCNHLSTVGFHCLRFLHQYFIWRRGLILSPVNVVCILVSQLRRSIARRSRRFLCLEVRTQYVHTSPHAVFFSHTEHFFCLDIPFTRAEVAHPQAWDTTRVLVPLLGQYHVDFIPANCTAHFHGKSSPDLAIRVIGCPQHRGMRLVPLFMLRRAQLLQLHCRIIANAPAFGISYRSFREPATVANTTVSDTHRYP